MARATGREPSIPRAERPIPYMPALLKAYPMVAVMQRIGMMQELYPRARPWMIFGAGPWLQDSTSTKVGAWVLLVKYSVVKPMIIPDQSPKQTHPKAYHLVTSSLSPPALRKLKVSGRT